MFGDNSSTKVKGLVFVKKNVVVEKSKFDAAFTTILQAKPVPREKIKARGKRAPKTPIIQKP